MSLAVDLLEQIAHSLTTAEPGTFSQEFTCERSWLSESDRTDNGPTVSLSWEAWRPLGVAGNLQLDQHVVGVLLQAHAGGTANGNLDPLAQLREELVEFFQPWRDEELGFRVIDLQAPAPFDRAKLLAPGIFQSRILLDCDVLRTSAAGSVPAAPDAAPILSAARTAVWQAIDAWPALSLLTRTYKTDLDVAELTLRDPAPHELPALALTWQPMPTEWWTNQSQQWQPSLNVSLWLPASWQAAAEHLAQQICLAVYQAKPEGSTVPYVKTATGHHPKRTGPINVQPVTIGRTGLIRALRVDVSFVLRSNLNPFEGG